MVYSPTAWRHAGRPLVRIEEVKGLRNERECRDRAWQFLLDEERATRMRNYTLQGQLRWQRFDLLSVENTSDDTLALLYLVGISRSYQRDMQAHTLRSDMSVQLEEQQVLTLDRAEEWQP